MANKPFDYTVINPLERPTSSDLNQLQGEAHSDARALMRRMFYDGGGTGTGSMEGFFPRDFPVYPTSTPSLSVDMYPGIGFLNGAAQTDIGGIAGLNDPYSYQVVTNTAIKNITVQGAASSGNHRYDLIQVRSLVDSERLTDSTVTDIYNPSLNSFGGASRYKTLTTDINGQTVQVIAYTGTPTAPLSYVIGQETAIISGLPTPPSVASGYLPVALILVTDTTTAINSGDITDQRPLLSFPFALLPAYGVDTIPYAAIQTVRQVQSVASYTATTSSFTTCASMAVTLSTGNAVVAIQPPATGALCAITLSNAGPDAVAAAEIRYNIVGPADTRTHLQRFSTGATSIPVSPQPIFFEAVAAGVYSISVECRVVTVGDTLSMSNFQLCVQQG